MEVRGVGANDVELIEKIFHRIMSEGPDLLKNPPKRFQTNNNISSSNKPIRYHHRSSTASSKHYAGPRGLCITPANQNNSNSENRMPLRNRSAEPAAKRQMALDCGLKSLPLSTRWTPAGRLSNSDSGDHSRRIQSQVLLQAPEGQVSPRRGLSGSKVRKGSTTPRPGSQTPRGSSIGDFGQDQSEGAYPITPSPRPQSLRFNTRFSQSGLPDDEEENGLVRSYKWNHSDQGMRLQRELSHLSSSRAMKRASEIMAHRIDPMYLMSGCKISLQSRYDIDEEEMKRLNEMTQVREGLMSDLKKMKFPYGVRAPTHVVTIKSRPDVTDTPRAPGNRPTNHLSQPQNQKMHPSSPASDPATNGHLQQERPPSVHTDTDNSLTGNDE